MDFASFTHAGPCLMGIVNVTPDSFSDAGRHFAPEAAAAHARQLADEGASIIDLGAEASSFFRAGVKAVPAEEQLARLLPVLDVLRALPRGVAISVDTRSAAVARAAIAAGAHIINDISAGLHEPELLRVVADSDAGVILMHMSAGYPATPAHDDPDIITTTRTALGQARERALAVGIPAARIALDPGIGFGKTMADNWRLALHAGETLPSGCVATLVVGLSRKRFLDTPPLGVPPRPEWAKVLKSPRPPEEHPRDFLTAMVTCTIAKRFGGIHRVHNVGLTARHFPI